MNDFHMSLPKDLSNVITGAKNLLAVAIALMTVGLIACSGDDGDSLALELGGLQPLSGGFYYEGWAVIDGAEISLGKFNTTSDGQLVTPAGKTIDGGRFDIPSELSDVTAVMVSIEPDGDSDGVPSDTRMLAGDITDGVASLVVGNAGAIGNTFESANGFYILATPTDGHLRSNENSGIWFRRAVDQLEPDPRGLFLPELPDGWLYEGWVDIEGIPVTSGKFWDPWDIDMSAPYSGPADMSTTDIYDVMFDEYVSVVVQGENGPELFTGNEGWKMFQKDGLSLDLFFHGPPEPGEDFLLNPPPGLEFPVDLAGLPIYVTIEPDPDNSPEPFGLKSLIGTVPVNAVSHHTYILTPGYKTFPTGTATLN
ncbi:MAG: anti-sigma factor [Chloroflexi bacterium]|jgi:hypothetical protein|nr:anti-sigma factor [Chloroflexota bacterium]MBT4074452.1 anti-sigma factor [Chloroflexota bacterium]MBT4514956.1 anti-sigma factor [Chloroflexota bacterium]MBT6681027.1 anti-sigma factor [Chloroflexota bacterium]